MKNTLGLTPVADDPLGLSEEGRMQARCLASVCRHNHVKKIFSSIEARSLETASIIKLQMQIPLIEIPELIEPRWGAWAGLPWLEIRRHLDLMTLEQRYDFVPPGGESWRCMDARLTSTLEFMVSQSVDALAIVTHGGLLGALLHVVKSIKKEDVKQLKFDNCSVTTMVHNSGKFQILSINDTAHLKNQMHEDGDNSQA